MKRVLGVGILICALCQASFAQLTIFVEAPHDDGAARVAVSVRPELQPLHDAYWDLIHTRLSPLKLDEVAKVFGPALGTSKDNQGKGFNPSPDRVLPTFAPGASKTGWIGPMMALVSGVWSGSEHTDFHAAGDNGYVEFWYGYDGKTPDAVFIFFHADDKFVPLASTNDFSKRLEWEKTKFDALKKWLDERMPKLTELGVVEVSEAKTSRVDLGGGFGLYSRNPGPPQSQHDGPFLAYYPDKGNWGPP